MGRVLQSAGFQQFTSKLPVLQLFANHAGYNQARLYQDNLKMIDGIENLTGVVPWLLYDFRSPYRLHPQLQQGWNRKGVLSQNGVRKKSWWVLRDYFLSKPN